MTGKRAVGLWLIVFLTATGAAGQVKAFIGARVLDGKGGRPIESGVVLVEAGRVKQVGSFGQVKVPAGAERIDLAGKTLIPGLINTHGHVAGVQGMQSGPQFYTEENATKQLALYARYGVTSVFSLGGDSEVGFRLRDTQDTAALHRARIFVAGTIITSKTEDEARKMVDQVAATRPNIIKIRVDDNLGATEKMRPEVYRAVIDQASKHKLRVAAHLYYLDDARGLLQAGASFLAHSIRDKDMDSETIELLKKRDACITPTLTREVSTFVYESRPAFFDDPFFLRDADPSVLTGLQNPDRMQTMRTSKSAQQYKAGLQVASRNLKKLADAGVRIAMGTDTGPVGRFQGYFEHMELELMAKAGMTTPQILKSATADAAACLGMSGQIGSVLAGAWADLLVLNANPLEDVKNFHAIHSVWIAGNQVPAK